MVTALPVSRTLPAAAGGRLGDQLGPLHRHWLEDLRAMLAEARQDGSRVWPRWSAIRYIDAVFAAQLERERTAIEQLGHAVDDKQSTRLWVAGELIALARWQLCHAVGLCHHAGEFAAMTARLVRAVEHWSAEVEEIVGSMSWDGLPAEARRSFAMIADESDRLPE
jgi:hypothetical protein